MQNYNPQGSVFVPSYTKVSLHIPRSPLIATGDMATRSLS